MSVHDESAPQLPDALSRVQRWRISWSGGQVRHEGREAPLRQGEDEDIDLDSRLFILFRRTGGSRTRANKDELTGRNLYATGAKRPGKLEP